MRISSNDLRGAGTLGTIATSQPVRPLGAVETRAEREPRPSLAPVEKVLEGEILRQNPVTAVESMLSDTRSLLFARAQVVEPATAAASPHGLSPFAVLFYQQHSSPENLSAGRPGQVVNQFV